MSFSSTEKYENTIQPRCFIVILRFVYVKRLSNCYILQSAIESLLQAALDWLADPRALRGGIGKYCVTGVIF